MNVPVLRRAAELLRRSAAPIAALCSAAAATFGAGCSDSQFTQPMQLGGQTVSPDTLENGRQAYMLNCYACHGEKGDGNGPASPGLRPPPRDFTQGKFKFVGVPAGELPTDEDLLRIVKGGLHGTPMLAWDVPDAELRSIVQYIKTFSPVWLKKKPGEKIEISADPWVGKHAEAVKRGEVVYHTDAQCASCHAYYVTKASYAQMMKAKGVDITEFRPDMYGAVAKESEYKIDGQKLKILPMDFLTSYPRSVRTAHEMEDLYVRIAAGVGGAGMPSWKGALKEDDLWALVHYVKHLVDMRDTPQGAAMRASLENQPPFVPPPAAPEIDADAGAGDAAMGDAGPVDAALSDVTVSDAYVGDAAPGKPMSPQLEEQKEPKTSVGGSANKPKVEAPKK